MFLSLAVWDFDRRARSTTIRTIDRPDAVVFTGQFDRIHRGLYLLKKGHINRLLISGANPGAGIQPDRFATQFNLDASQLEALYDGRLVLATGAESTLQNAAETACWFKSGQGALVLITKTDHMPRASLALELILGDSEILREGIPAKTRATPTRRLGEFLGYLATYVLAAAPNLFTSTLGPYEDGCP